MPDTMDDGVRRIFEDLRISVVPTDIPDLAKLEMILKRYGATVVPYSIASENLEDLLLCTHIVATSVDFPQYYAALDRVKAVVTPKWVIDSIGKSKPLPIRPYSPDPALILRDVVVYFTGLPQGDVEVLTGGLHALGGLVSIAKSKLVTHVVAMETTPSLAQTIADGRLKAKVVLPHWLNDCLKLGRRLHERPYQLPDPEILKLNPPRVKPTSSSHIRGASSPRPSVDLMSPENSPSRRLHSSTALRGQSVCFSHEGVSTIHRTLREELVQAAGGRLVDNVKRATVYVSLYRDGEGYMEAYRRKLIIGNLAWLDFVISHGKFTLPTQRLMHYPVPRNGISGFAGTKICITNYTGEARIYLENVILACGGEYTKTLSPENSHLIAATDSGEKVAAAKSWNIAIVNHLWLEESYSQCEFLSVTRPKYTYFPRQTNLGETLGQIQMDRAALELQVHALKKKYGVLDEEESADPVADADNDAPVELEDAEMSDDDDSVLGSTPASPSRSASKLTLAARAANETPTAQDAKTPQPSRVARGKENETPPTTGRRGAKDRALSKVQEMAEDMNMFSKEMKRKGGLVHGRERRRSHASPVVEAERPDRSLSKKRQSSEFDVPTDDDNEVVTKKQKVVKAVRNQKSPVVHRLLVTMYEPWQNNAKKESSDKNKLRNLGIFITEKPTEATILCAPAIVRTKKFVTALAGAPQVVSTDFLDDALENQELPDPKDYALQDGDGEKRWQFNLSLALKRAKSNDRRLLKDVQIFCTPKVKGGWEGYREIAAANGGSCRLYEGKEKFHVRFAGSEKLSTKASGRSGGASQEGGLDPVYLVSSKLKPDQALWERFRKMAANADMEPRICSENWLLHAAMTQALEWGEDFDLTVEERS